MVESKPDKVILDFELAAVINTCRELIEDVAVEGCLFHWKKAIFTHVYTLNFSRAVKRDENMQSSLQMLYSLAYLPQADEQMLHHAVSTNNAPEAWNRNWNGTSSRRDNYWKVLSHLQTEEGICKTKWREFTTGVSTSTPTLEGPVGWYQR